MLRDLTQMPTPSRGQGKIASLNPIDGSDIQDSKIYYWVGGLHNGRPIILSAFGNSYDEAYAIGAKELNSRGIDFKVYPLKYRSVEKANAIIRRDLLSNGNDIEDVLSRARHVLD